MAKSCGGAFMRDDLVRPYRALASRRGVSSVARDSQEDGERFLDTVVISKNGNRPSRNAAYPISVPRWCGRAALHFCAR